MRIVILLLMFGLAGHASARNAEHGAVGYWLTENGKAIVQFTPCADGLASSIKPRICGQIVWTEAPRDESGALKRDALNPDEDLRSRAICGLPLVGDLELASGKKLEDGWIYNPRSGDTFGAEAELVSAQKLKLRGFLGISLLGQSQVWTRVNDDRGGC
ncbi:MAG: DUF2147 domain-containing protein [Pseudomonadota bacterium]